MKRPNVITCNFCNDSEVPKKSIQRHWRLFCKSIPAVADDEHTCSICQTIKPLTEFSKTKSKVGGVEHTCKACALAILNHWKRQNRDRKIESYETLKTRPGRWKLNPCPKCGRLFNWRGMNLHSTNCTGDPNAARRPEDPFIPDMETIKHQHLLADPVRLNRSRSLWHQYGITIDQYEAMFAAQKGLCAICGQPPRGERKSRTIHLVVDHCHSANKVRSLLCSTCNAGIGGMRDDPALFDKAKAYVIHWKSVFSAESHVSPVTPVTEPSGL